MTDLYKPSNIVRVGNKDKTEFHIYSILSRLHPSVYDKKENRCIILQVKNSLIDYAGVLIKKFTDTGILKEVSRKQVDIETGGYILEGGWEIKLERAKGGLFKDWGLNNG